MSTINLERLLQTIGMRVFVQYFQDFNDRDLLNAEVVALLQRQEGFSPKSCRSRTAKARRIIHKLELETEALSLIAKSKVPPDIAKSAKQLLAGPPEIQKLKEKLEALQGSKQPQAPQVLKRIQRVLKNFERPNRITRFVKRTRGATCQLCGELGFEKRDGKRYCEVHHLFHLSKNPPTDCLLPEYLVVLCATCHRRLHYAHVDEPIREADGWRVRVDDEIVLFQFVRQ